jgi:hypothetical protein
MFERLSAIMALNVTPNFSAPQVFFIDFDSLIAKISESQKKRKRWGGRRIRIGEEFSSVGEKSF